MADELEAAVRDAIRLYNEGVFKRVIRAVPSNDIQEDTKRTVHKFIQWQPDFNELLEIARGDDKKKTLVDFKPVTGPQWKLALIETAAKKAWGTTLRSDYVAVGVSHWLRQLDVTADDLPGEQKERLKGIIKRLSPVLKELGNALPGYEGHTEVDGWVLSRPKAIQP